MGSERLPHPALIGGAFGGVRCEHREAETGSDDRHGPHGRIGAQREDARNALLRCDVSDGVRVQDIDRVGPIGQQHPRGTRLASTTTVRTPIRCAARIAGACRGPAASIRIVSGMKFSLPVPFTVSVDPHLFSPAGLGQFLRTRHHQLAKLSGLSKLK